MKLKIKLLVYLYFFSSLMIFFVKKPINEVNYYQNTSIVEYKIREGDTLWDISYKFTTKNREEFIYFVKKLNKLDNSMLFIDQIILLPINIWYYI